MDVIVSTLPHLSTHSDIDLTYAYPLTNHLPIHMAIHATIHTTIHHMTGTVGWATLVLPFIGDLTRALFWD